VPERRRFATRDELADLVHEHAPTVSRVDILRVIDTIDMLATVNEQPVNTLVQITVTEPTPQVEFREPRRE
jgi:hypothetical protein